MYNIKFKIKIPPGFHIFFWVEWLKRVGRLARKNTFTVSWTAAMSVLGTEGLQLILYKEIFGTTTLVLMIVLGTVLANTYYGVQKSKYTRNYYKKILRKGGLDKITVELYLAKIQKHEFNPKRMQFVVFKCLSLLAYLFFASSLLQDGGTFLDYGIEFLCKVPLAIFWYYEFKSIGENSAVIYDNKASIFVIIEDIFELKVSHILGRKSKKEKQEEESEFKRNSHLERMDQEEHAVDNENPL